MSQTSWNDDQLFSSEKHDWATPQALFDVLDDEFCFELDAAASSINAKCAAYITEEHDALSISWRTALTDAGADPVEASIWLNPPYGRSIGKWIEKAHREAVDGCVVVVLTFCRTDTKWWHQWAMKAAEVRLIEGRIRFEGATASAPAPSCLLIFDERKRLPRFTVETDLPRR